MNKIYVVGFISDKKKVLLIKKNRPEWQKDKFNGIGGKVEWGEDSLAAMIRETKEETGLEGLYWELIEKVVFSSGGILYIYKAITSTKTIETYRSLTDEKVELFSIDKLPKNIISDIKLVIEQQFSPRIN